MPFRTPYLFPRFDDNETLALRPLLIAGMVRPIEDGDGGINIAVVTDNPAGMLCVINPYIGMQEGDQLVICWERSAVYTKVVEADEVNKPLFFYLPATIAQPGWVEECYYQLTRFGENTPDAPSVALRLRVKLTRPGGRDKAPHLPDGHSELHPLQLPEEVVRQGIDVEWAKKGVPIIIPFYPEMAVGDSILVHWGSANNILAPHTVTQDEADRKTPIVMIADQAAILAGGDSAALLLRYDIHDPVWNWAVRRSQSTRVRVDAGGWRLEAPVIKESVNGFIIIRDLDKQNVTIRVHVQSKDFAHGDKLTFCFIGTPQTGKPLIRSACRTIDNIPSILDWEVSYADIRAIAMGLADASYVLEKTNGETLSSRRTFAQVVGDVVMLPEPTIRELRGDTLHSDEPYATVDVRYPDMANGDLINLIWRGTQPDGRPYVYEEERIVSENDAKAGLITFYIGAEHIRPLARLDLSYRVSNDQAALYGVTESERLLAKVEKIRATLPMPVVEEADPPDVLDPSRVFDIVHVLIGAKTEKDDIVSFGWHAEHPLGSTSDWVPITTVTAGHPVRFRVDERFVTINIGQIVEVFYWIKHAATGLFSHSATLKLMVGYLVGELPPPIVEQASDGLLDPMKALNGVDVQVSYASMDTALDTVNLRWIGTPGPGTSVDQVKPAHASGTVAFHLLSSVVGPNINRAVTVDYRVNRYGKATESQSLTLRVLSFQDPEKDLPRPEVPQALNSVLDLMMFSGDPRVLVKRWPFIAFTQRIWLLLIGKTTAGAAYIIRILDGREITSTQVTNGLNETLRRSELLMLGHSSEATVICKVAFDNDLSEDSACVFPVLNLTVRTRYDYVTPIIDGVSDSRGEVIDGGKTRDDHVTVSGTATRGEIIELFDGGSTSLGTAEVGVDSRWCLKIGILTEKDYRITAKALYDANPVVSGPRTFTVKFTQPPEILSVSDSRSEIADGATTYDNSVLIEGIATPNMQVQLFESNASLVTLDVDDDGRWQHRINNLRVKTYSLVATAKYDVDPPSSPARTFVVALAVTPTISRVTDIRGEVDMNGTTYYRAVTLTGKASPNETITLLDAGTPIDTVKIDASGNWTYQMTDLSFKVYRLVARAEYGSHPVSAPPRVFTVAAHIAPTISSVTDSVGSVAHNGTTYDTSVKVQGTATPREQIQLYNKGSLVGAPVTVKADKSWEAPASGLALTSHSLTAKALYDVQPVESDPRNFTVAAHIAPTLTSVHDGLVEVPNNGETKRTSVTLRGAVTPYRQVQIYDNNGYRLTVTAGASEWRATLAVSVGSHAVYAKAVSTGQNSTVRSFRVISAIPPLTIYNAPMYLNAWHFRDDHTPGNPPSGAYGDRSAQGGVPPYRYQSSNNDVAEVNATTGRVISKGNGSATITVTDGANQRASYSVSTANVERLFGTGVFSTYTQCANAAAGMGGRIPSLSEWRAFISNYQGRRTIERWCWASDSAGFAKRWVIYPADGRTDTRIDIGFGGGTADGFGIKRA
ncbi:Ig-like domain-containing protein [Pseudomonas sp. B21128]|uniref:Ig-like domain-containing protein n=1 Tax=Pseudomonas sp. B21128 TaxID=3235110 RepID=UPI0037849CB9